MSRARGLRREAPILLPASLLLFALLAAITLLSYRTGVARFAEGREQATLRLAVTLADAMRLAKSDDVAQVARWVPAGGSLAIYDARGAVLASFGFTDAQSLALPDSSALAAPRIGESGGERGGALAAPPALRALVPYRRGAQRYLLRLEVPEPALFAQRRSLAILTPVVLGLAVAVALLSIFFLRALMRPYEQLLERARAALPAPPPTIGEPSGPAASDDVEFLLSTFDRALAALRSENAHGGRTERPIPGAGEALAELSAVDLALGPRLESGLLLFSRTGTLLAANPAAVELLGGDFSELRSEGSSAPNTAESALAAHPAFAALVSAAIADGRSIPRASVAIDRAGRRVELGLTLQTLRRDENADAGGFLVLFADVTDLTRRESEERLAAGLAQLGELSAGVAHELRNSLATLQGYLALAARRELPSAAREEIAEARREASELARVVDDFLSFARPGGGALEAVDLATLLARAATDPALAGVAVTFDAPAAALPPLAGDPHLLQRALRNLLLNAVQATQARAARDATSPGAVVVRLLHVPGRATITIDDSGTGLAPAIRARLFEPFASGRAGGAGLGLAMARRIVLMHGGSLDLQTLAAGGVRAEIHLPLGDSATKGST